MSTGLKALGIVGAGAALALGISASQPTTTPAATPSAAVASQQVSNCHPSYSGCLKKNAGDYDCASGSGDGPNYTGAVQVYGSDPFGLDRDGDGWGCE